MADIYPIRYGSRPGQDMVDNSETVSGGRPWYDPTHPSFAGGGADPTFANDSAASLQDCLTKAFNSPGAWMVIPFGKYKCVTGLTTPADIPGAVKIMGLGRPRSFRGGVDGDPAASQGAEIVYTGNTGDLFLAACSAGNARQYITIESVGFFGNLGGATGHCLHFQGTIATAGILPTLRDVTVNGAKETGIFYDGNVFESQLFNVRGSQCGGRGFKAAANGAGLPGETRGVGCSFDSNLVGVDLGGGGHFSFLGLTCTANSNEGLIASGVLLQVTDLQLEVNGTAAGNQATLSLTGAVLIGVLIGCLAGGTGNGLSFTGSLWCHVIGYSAHSSVTGAGYKDFRFDNASTRCTVENYTSDDFVDRFALGTGGGHAVRRGGQWLTGQAHSHQTVTLAAGGNAQFDSTLADEFLLIYTGINSGLIMNPVVYSSGNFQGGQVVIVSVYNNSGGVLIGTNWQGLWHLAGAWVDPANGKTRKISFSFDEARGGFYEIARSAADIT